MKALATILLLTLSTVAAAEQYEYKVIDLDRFTAPEVYEQTLNAAGREGWKVVANERITFNGMHTVLRFVLMRETGEGE